MRPKKGGGARRPRATNETIDAALRDFAAQQGVDLSLLRPHEDDALFERFAVLHILRRHLPDLSHDDLDLVSTGDVDDNQLDAVAFVAEGRLISNEEQVAALLEEQEALDLELLVVQITRAQKFDRLKIGGFIRGVHSFLSSSAFFKENQALERKRALKDLILSAGDERGVSVKLSVRGYFAADSTLPREGNLLGDFAQAREILVKMESVRDAEIEPVDRRRLSDMVAVDRQAHDYSTVLAPYSGFAPTAHLSRLPRAAGAGECWVGAVDLSSFLLLLSREDGQGLKEGVFEHNVRGFLPDSEVNDRIKETLLSGAWEQFPLLNNGVTIVAETILPSAAPLSGGDTRLKLSNYQVVNGLQTTHVLYRLRDELERRADRLFVPIKLIATQDALLQRQIVYATNRQNPIAGLALHANDPKTLEIQELIREREAKAGAEWPMVFERRSGLSTPARRMLDAQRVDLGDALRAFVAVFLELPHRAEAGIKPTLEMIGDRVLRDDQAPEAYLLSAILLAQTRRLLRRSEDPGLFDEFAPLEHHLTLALRMLLEPTAPPKASSAKAVDYSERMTRAALDRDTIEPAFEHALEAVRAARRRLPKARYKRPMESAALTKRVISEAARAARSAR